MAKTVMLKYLHSLNKNTLHFTAGNARWTSVNDGSYHFLFKGQEEAEWFHVGKQIPPVCILEYKRSAAKVNKAINAQVAGEMIAVACSRKAIFGGGDYRKLEKFQREASLRSTLVGACTKTR